MNRIALILILLAACAWGDTNAPALPPLPPQVAESGTDVPHAPADGLKPPAGPRLAKWESGRIMGLTEKSFMIYMRSKWYDIYHCGDLEQGEWKLVARLESETALNDRLVFWHNHPGGFYRVIEVNKPHPPERLSGIGRQPRIAGRKFGGGF